MSRLYNALPNWPLTPTEINSEVRRDLIWWDRFIQTFNGVAMMPWQEFGEPDSELTTDACLEGGGATFQGEHITFAFPQHIRDGLHNINFLEFLTVIIAVKVWKDQLKGKRLIIHCDNMVTVYVMNTGRAKSRDLQRASRELAFLAATGEFELKSRHLPGAQNRVADWLSRMHCNETARWRFAEWNKKHHSREVQVPDQFFFLNDSW